MSLLFLSLPNWAQRQFGIEERRVTCQKLAPTPPAVTVPDLTTQNPQTTMTANQRGDVLTALLRGTYLGAILALITYLSFGRLQKWDWMGVECMHFVVEGALLIGLANGLARLMHPTSFIWNSTQKSEKVPVNWRSRIARWFSPFEIGPITVCIAGVVNVEIMAGTMGQGFVRGLMICLMGISCLFYLMGLLFLLISFAKRSLPASSESEANVQTRTSLGHMVVIGGPIAGPMIGYYLGSAITLIPAAHDWSLAPQYGVMLGCAVHLILGALALSVIPTTVATNDTNS
jgi:hypothetical protein